MGDKYIPLTVLHPLLWTLLFLNVEKQDHPSLSIVVSLLLITFFGLWWVEAKYPELFREEPERLTVIIDVQR